MWQPFLQVTFEELGSGKTAALQIFLVSTEAYFLETLTKSLSEVSIFQEVEVSHRSCLHASATQIADPFQKALEKLFQLLKHTKGVNVVTLEKPVHFMSARMRSRKVRRARFITSQYISLGASRCSFYLKLWINVVLGPRTCKDLC